jgi:hypothetical protein
MPNSETSVGLAVFEPRPLATDGSPVAMRPGLHSQPPELEPRH